MTILYTAFKLNDSVDLDKAREIARNLSSEYDTLLIRIKDDREMTVCCSTIVPDMKSLWAVTPYLLEIVRNALDLFMNAYEKDGETKAESMRRWTAFAVRSAGRAGPTSHRT